MPRLIQAKGGVVLAGITIVFAALLTGCRQDMQDQPKFYPQRGSSLYSDGRSSRPQVAGTVARSQGEASDYFHTGLIDGKEADGLPVPLTAGVMARGQERFNIYCAPCHSRVGNGAGRIVERGYYPAASFHSTRLRDAPLGHFFAVMTNGLGAMPNYAAELTPQDRWAVAAYIRALQLSQNARATDLAPNARPEALQDIVVQEGYASAFLEPWFPRRRAAPASIAAPPTSVAPVQATVTPTAPSNLPVEVVAKPLAAASAGKPTPSAPTQEASVTAPTAPTPSVAPAKKEAPAAVHDTAAGQSVYLHNCAGCHGMARAGNPPNIPSLVGIVGKVGEERIRSVLADGIPTGKPPMPSFSSRLSPEDIDNLLAFLQAGK